MKTEPAITDHTDDPCDETPSTLPARIRLIPDRGAESPRDFDNLGKMYCEHRRYYLGDCDNRGRPTVPDPRVDPADGEHYHPDVVIALPLGLYDHSGITMYVGRTHPQDSAGWDSGCVGVIYVTRADIRANWPSWKRLTTKRLAQVEAALRQEVETYDQYLRGDVYGFVVESHTGETLDSCWGFYGGDPRTNGMWEHWDDDTRKLFQRDGFTEGED